MSTVINDDRICNICGKEFDFPCHLERHKIQIRKCKPKTEDYKCNYCNICCVNKYTLAKHFLKCKVKKDKDSINTNTTNTTNTTNNKQQSLENFTEIKNEKVNDIKNIKELLNDIMNYISSADIDKKLLVGKLENVLSNLGNTTKTQNININTDNANNSQNNLNNNNTTNSNNTINNTSYTNNNTINNNIINNIIFPFGLEDYSFLTDEECLRLLKTRTNIIPVIDKLYSKKQNGNFIRNNANKDIITILDKNYNIKTLKSKEFYERIITHTIDFLENLLHLYQSKLHFRHKLAFLINIKDLRSLYIDKTNYTDLSSFLDAKFQSSIIKEYFKKFIEKISRDENIKNQELQKLEGLTKMIKKIYNDISNHDINEKFLQTNIWSKPFKCADTNPNTDYNNLCNNYFESTKRYKFLMDRMNEEFVYFEKNGISIGNLNAYHKILLERAKQEIKMLEDKYHDITEVKKKKIIDNIMKVMVYDVNESLLREINKIKFINNNQNEENVKIPNEEQKLIQDKDDIEIISKLDDLANIGKISNVEIANNINIEALDISDCESESEDEIILTNNIQKEPVTDKDFLEQGYIKNEDGEWEKIIIVKKKNTKTKKITDDLDETDEWNDNDYIYCDSDGDN